MLLEKKNEQYVTDYKTASRMLFTTNLRYEIHQDLVIYLIQCRGSFLFNNWHMF